LSGVKNGKTVGMMLSTVQKDAVTGSRKDETNINYFPNQLFRKSPILKINCEILILEDSLFFGNDKFIN